MLPCMWLVTDDYLCILLENTNFFLLPIILCNFLRFSFLARKNMNFSRDLFSPYSGSFSYIGFLASLALNFLREISRIVFARKNLSRETVQCILPIEGWLSVYGHMTRIARTFCVQILQFHLRLLLLPQLHDVPFHTQFCSRFYKILKSKTHIKCEPKYYLMIA